MLLQFATKDPYVADAARALIDAVKAPKESKFYDCGHDMNRQAMDDRRGVVASGRSRLLTNQEPETFTGVKR